MYRYIYINNQQSSITQAIYQCMTFLLPNQIVIKLSLIMYVTTTTIDKKFVIFLASESWEFTLFTNTTTITITTTH